MWIVVFVVALLSFAGGVYLGYEKGHAAAAALSVEAEALRAAANDLRKG